MGGFPRLLQPPAYANALLYNSFQKCIKLLLEMFCHHCSQNLLLVFRLNIFGTGLQPFILLLTLASKSRHRGPSRPPQFPHSPFPPATNPKKCGCPQIPAGVQEQIGASWDIVESVPARGTGWNELGFGVSFCLCSHLLDLSLGGKHPPWYKTCQGLGDRAATNSFPPSLTP